MNKKILLALAATTGLALTACGGDGDSNGVAEKSADEILTAAKDAAIEAGSVHVTGDLSTGGAGGYSLDMSISDSAATGTLTIGGAELELLSVEEKFYIKADKAGWDAMAPGTGAGELLDGKYVFVPEGDENFGQMATFADFNAFVEDSLKADGEVSKGEETDLDGTDVIALVDNEDDGKLYIATNGDPLPVQISGPDDEGNLVFDWGADVNPEAPAEEDVVDMSEISQG